MADARLRRLERRAPPVERGRLLRERLRAGRLDPDRLSLAAYLGDRVASETLGADAPVPSADLREWVALLAPWGKEACVRAAVAAARRAVGPSPALAAAEAWLACPCPGHRRAAGVAAGHAAEPLPAEAAARAAAVDDEARYSASGMAMHAVVAADARTPGVRREVEGELLRWALEA